MELDKDESTTIINLFDDNQFYVADPSPDLIGEIAAQIAPLWTSHDSML
jgi:hypothetical protein